MKAHCTIVEIFNNNLWNINRNIFRNFYCLLYEMPIKNIFMGAKPRNFKKVINFVS